MLFYFLGSKPQQWNLPTIASLVEKIHEFSLLRKNYCHTMASQTSYGFYSKSIFNFNAQSVNYSFNLKTIILFKVQLSEIKQNTLHFPQLIFYNIENYRQWLLFVCILFAIHVKYRSIFAEICFSSTIYSKPRANKINRKLGIGNYGGR